MADPEQSSQTQQPERSTIQEMLDVAHRFIDEIKARNPVVSDEVSRLRSEQSDPIRANQQDFQHQVAYVTQDAEKTLGHQLPLTDATRDDLTRLAGSAPGLNNERMSSLLQSTASINDPDLVRDIRTRGAETGRQADQNTDQIRDRIEHLEHAVRQADRAPELAPPPAAPNVTTNSGQQERPDAGNQRPDNPTEARRDSPEAGPRDGTTRAQEDPRAQSNGQRVDPRSEGAAFLDNIQGVLRNVGAQRATAPWDATPQPFADRLSVFQGRMNEGRDRNGLQDAERAGRAALDAMEAFRSGDGATIMNRIASAARSDPEGMAGVLAGMREGGRYQDLRQRFNGALNEEKGFSQAYDKAAEALAKYGEARTGVEQIIARRPDAANLTAKFQQLDAEIGEKAENTPSRREGKSALEDISKQAAEIIQKAVEAVKSFFNPHGPDNNRPPGPSPS